MNTYEQHFLDLWLSSEWHENSALYYFKYHDYNAFPLMQGMLHDVAALAEELSALDLERVVAYADALPPKYQVQGRLPLSSFSERVKEIYFVHSIIKIWMYSYTNRKEKESLRHGRSLGKLRQNAANTIQFFCLGILAPVPTAVELKLQHQIDMKYGSRWNQEHDSMAIIRAKTELAFSILHEFGLQYQPAEKQK